MRVVIIARLSIGPGREHADAVLQIDDAGSWWIVEVGDVEGRNSWALPDWEPAPLSGPHRSAFLPRICFQTLAPTGS